MGSSLIHSFNKYLLSISHEQAQSSMPFQSMPLSIACQWVFVTGGKLLTCKTSACHECQVHISCVVLRYPLTNTRKFNQYPTLDAGNNYLTQLGTGSLMPYIEEKPTDTVWKTISLPILPHRTKHRTKHRWKNTHFWQSILLSKGIIHSSIHEFSDLTFLRLSDTFTSVTQ